MNYNVKLAHINNNLIHKANDNFISITSEKYPQHFELINKVNNQAIINNFIIHQK